MTDPLSAILIPLGIHVGKSIWDRVWNEQQSAVYSPSTGQTYLGGGYGQLVDLSLYRTHLVTVDYLAGDDWTADWVTNDNPCLFVLASHDFVQVEPCTIDDSFSLELPTGYYEVGLQVFDEHLVEPDYMQLVAWQQTGVDVAWDQHVDLEIRIDPDFHDLLATWDDVLERVTDDLAGIRPRDELSVTAYDDALDMRFTVPDPRQPTRVRASAVLSDQPLRMRALEARHLIELLGWGFKITSDGAVRLRTHASVSSPHDTADIVFRLCLMLWKVFDVHPDDVYLGWVN